MSTSSGFDTAAKATLVEYFQKTSLNGFGLLYYIRRRKYQRILWFMFILMGITFATFVCLTTIVLFLSEPTVTALDTQQETLYSEPFPVIAICPNNKISYQALRSYAKYIAMRSTTFKPEKFWMRKLEIFKGFFDTESIEYDEALEFESFAENMSIDISNATEILQRLAPPCQNFIEACFWDGIAIICDEHLVFKAFIDGFCCVFNFHHNKPESVNYPNEPESGLAVILKVSDKDHFYTEGNSNGFTVKIFDSQRNPDTSTGEMKEFSVTAGDDVDVKLNLISQRTTDKARAHTVEKRGCNFPNENESNGQADCLYNCKLQSIESLCDCCPFYAHGHNSTVPQCSFVHMKCMERYKVTWQTYLPDTDAKNYHLKDELLDSLKCRHCSPMCNFERYDYRKKIGKLRNTFREHINRKFLGSNIANRSSDLALVKIYYSHELGIRYQKNVLFNWYQILSNMGGVIGISMGCSIISGIEIFYFVIIRLFENYIKLRKSGR